MAIVSIITNDNRRRTFAKQVFAHAKQCLQNYMKKLGLCSLEPRMAIVVEGVALSVAYAEWAKVPSIASSS